MACADLDHEEHVQAPQRDRTVHMEEAAGQHGHGLGVQELPPRFAIALRCGLDLHPLQDPPHRGRADPYPKPSNSPWIRLYPQPGFSRASCLTSATISALTGGRPPPRRGWVHHQRTIRRCQRSSVSGATRRPSHNARGTSQDKAASTARSAQSSLGFGCGRRSTTTAWRSTSSSAFFDADDRASSASHPVTRTNIRYSSRTVTARDTGSPGTTSAAGFAGQQPMPVLGLRPDPRSNVAGQRP